MDDWTLWIGGACPVAPATLVEVQLRYAGHHTGPAGSFCWSHDLYNAYGAENVVRYRTVPAPDVVEG
ncbi:hypothetical protein LWE61_17540 [Sphingobium sufflavum]|uniref:hypothetical protein n=1 Tax=Sphingobium sufflavum TaxID=1129547 RepID=UPI001F2C030D|nr:hypothetical protein [Sphingobium sufflavum]MCE7798344.1 hypothetical protein [Sphingobium sufflavum]